MFIEPAKEGYAVTLTKKQLTVAPVQTKAESAKSVNKARQAMDDERNARRLYEMRCKRIIETKGKDLMFIGGTALDGVTVVNMESLVEEGKTCRDRELLVMGIQDSLRKAPRRWTVTYAFIHLNTDNDIEVRTDTLYVEDAVAGDMDLAATAILEQQWELEEPTTRLGNIWVSSPASVEEDPDTIIEQLDGFMEDNGFYDDTLMRMKCMQIRERRETLAKGG